MACKLFNLLLFVSTKILNNQVIIKKICQI